MADTSSRAGYGALFLQPESTFGTDPGTWVPATHYVEVKKVTDNRDETYYPNDVVRQGLQQHTSGVIGVKSDSTLDIEMYLHGYSSAAVTSDPVLATDRHPDAMIVSAALGGCIAGGYDETGITALGTDKNTLVCASTASFVVGQAILVDGQVGWIKTITDAVTMELEHDLLETPDAEDVIYGSITCFPIDAFDDTMSPSLAFKWLGDAADDVTVYTGCRPSALKISGAPKDFLTMTTTFAVHSWVREDTGGSPEPLAYAYPAREQIVGARLLIQENTGTVTAIEADCSKFDLDLGLGLAPKLDLNDSQGVSEWRKNAMEATLTVDPIQGAETTAKGWEYNYEHQYRYTVMLQVGTDAGRTIAICMPSAELVELPKTTDRDGLNAKSLKFKAMAHTRDTGTGSDANAINKVVKVAFL